MGSCPPLTVLEDAGHIPHIEDPAAFNAALVSTLQSLRNSP
ncbi:hypothetical protein AIOL_003591 [Candidatus Rhodobacter oscarellae]|uniref:3-oxoadipate enol-lactonase n=1 Tax=Candidatus Rhodobacter oscarellae TaxID=1675527 RepID=A0A0J9GYT4_9RHOB|nr:hypothetical protein AIOL_003591 [Candidatus Rhodobacter lobularis]